MPCALKDLDTTDDAVVAGGRSVFLIWFTWIISEVFLSACNNFSYRRSVFSAAAYCLRA